MFSAYKNISTDKGDDGSMYGVGGEVGTYTLGGWLVFHTPEPKAQGELLLPVFVRCELCVCQQFI